MLTLEAKLGAIRRLDQGAIRRLDQEETAHKIAQELCVGKTQIQNLQKLMVELLYDDENIRNKDWQWRD